MPSQTIRLGLMLLSTCLLGAPQAQAHIESVTRLTARPALYERVDFVVMLSATWQDPYCSTEVRLDLELTAPSGRTITLPAFYERGASGQSSIWRARFAPQEKGDYHGRFVLAAAGARHESAPVDLSVAASDQRGFLRVANPWCLRFDRGDPFRGIGENIGWEARSNDDSRYFKALHENPRFNYEYLLGRLSASGGNFVRTWMCAWNLPLEWSKVIDSDRYTDYPGRFNPGAIARLDELIDLAESTDVYLMLTIDPHGSFLGRLWELNPYNARNGGPAATAADFFTNGAAKARYKDRLRYLVARWGYSPHLAMWEFFNEIDNAMYGQAPERIPDAVITTWHAEMSAYLRQLDPYGRPITTSISHRDVAGLNRIPTLDLNQKHIYKNTVAIPETLHRYLQADGKPYVIGEFGYEWDWSKNFNEFAADMDRDFKQGLWLGLFSPTPVLPMTWWWEFFDQRGLTAYFAGVREISDRMLAAGNGRFAEVPSTAGAATSLAVRCGASTFVYVLNPTDAPVAARLELPQLASDHQVVEYFDPKNRHWQSDPTGRTVPAGKGLPTIALAPHQAVILVLR